MHLSVLSFILGLMWVFYKAVCPAGCSFTN